ncbi:biogenesis WDR12 homolog [Octopus vulgaris]|uniref:Biogenesis WDR12 homolog n=2 Tax=Octopus TaxID=6643 RepID=A0AA36B5I3_OCTVU|nr:ribosome biogenesis protein WDR12 homolog [Octopus sinensis]CAI9727768.1 biogenesis WDR12 homolog [Octopus vulgaris]
MSNTGSHVLVRLFTKQSQYSVPDAPFSVPSKITVKELNSLVNGLLKEALTDTPKLVDFDFLIKGEFLHTTLLEHLVQSNISTEDVIEVEYLERHPAPQPEDSLVHDDWVSCIHGGKQYILSGCYDNTIHIWNKEGVNLKTISGHTAPVLCVSWIKHDESPVCEFVTGSHDQTLLLWQWNPKTKEVKCNYVCRGHSASVDCVAVDHTKKRMCSGSWDNMLKIWSTVADDNTAETTQDEEVNLLKKKKICGYKAELRVPLLTLAGHSEGISSLCWVDRNQICTASWDHTMKIWDLERAESLTTMQGSKVFLDLAYSPLNQLIITGSADRHIRLWDHRTNEGAIVKNSFSSHRGWVSSVCWSPNSENHFISGSYDMLLKLWDVRSPKAPLYNMTGHEEKILAVDWSIPELMLSGGADKHMKIFHHTNTKEFIAS